MDASKVEGHQGGSSVDSLATRHFWLLTDSRSHARVITEFQQ